MAIVLMIVGLILFMAAIPLVYLTVFYIKYLWLYVHEMDRDAVAIAKKALIKKAAIVLFILLFLSAILFLLLYK